jgi:hypothetical protein
VRTVLKLARLPIDDYLAALERALPRPSVATILVIVMTTALSWWVYVPIHELLHAAGCALGGGEVTRLEIDAVYGAALLQRVFPFVVVGSEYAGQLTGFDTKGSDLTYLLTDFLPFVLTILVGVPLLRAAGSAQGQMRAAVALGAAIPLALAPFVSVTGDYYEMGSILVSRAVSMLVPDFDVRRWRSDDLFKLAGGLSSGGARLSDAAGVTLSVVVGLVLAFATYGVGRWWAGVARQKA